MKETENLRQILEKLRKDIYEKSPPSAVTRGAASVEPRPEAPAPIRFPAPRPSPRAETVRRKSAPPDLELELPAAGSRRPIWLVLALGFASLSLGGAFYGKLPAAICGLLGLIGLLFWIFRDLARDRDYSEMLTKIQELESRLNSIEASKNSSDLSVEAEEQLQELKTVLNSLMKVLEEPMDG